MIGHFQTLLAGIVADCEQRISQLPLLTEAEQYQLLVEWHDLRAEYPQDQCIHQLFEAQVDQRPDAVAVVFEDQQITYQELNRRANQVAHHLHSLAIEPDGLVGLCLEQSLEMIVGLLGILKAGGRLHTARSSISPGAIGVDAVRFTGVNAADDREVG